MTNFRIQLLSDNNVVLVHATGHESEVFLPQLHNERFALRNIIRSRRPHARYEADEDTFNQEQAPSSYINQRPRLTTATAGLAPIGEGPPPGGGRRGSVYAGLSGGGGGEGSNHGRVLQFSLKLISNEKVVLVESRGHESEIFLPYFSDQLIAMKRVTANELIQCSRLKSRPQVPPVVDVTQNPPLTHHLTKNDNLFFNPSRFFIQNNSIETNTPEPGKQVKPRRKRRYQAKYAGAGDQQSGKR